jgi:hypothetical protein
MNKDPFAFVDAPPAKRRTLAQSKPPAKLSKLPVASAAPLAAQLMQRRQDTSAMTPDPSASSASSPMKSVRPSALVPVRRVLTPPAPDLLRPSDALPQPGSHATNPSQWRKQHRWIRPLPPALPLAHDRFSSKPAPASCIDYVRFVTPGLPEIRILATSAQRLSDTADVCRSVLRIG